MSEKNITKVAGNQVPENHKRKVSRITKRVFDGVFKKASRKTKMKMKELDDVLTSNGNNGLVDMIKAMKRTGDRCVTTNWRRFVTQTRRDLKAAKSDDCLFSEWVGDLVETERLHAESAEKDKVSERRAIAECILLEKKAAAAEADKIATEQMFSEAVELASNVQESLDRLRAEDAVKDAVKEATQKAAEAALKAAETKSANDARIDWLVEISF